MSRQKDAELAYSQIAALEQRAPDAAARRASLEESLAALGPQRCLPGRDRGHPAGQDRQPDRDRPERKRPSAKATEQRLARQQAETEALARARTAADSREEMGREMARLAERKAAAETEYDQTVAKLWDEYQLS